MHTNQKDSVIVTRGWERWLDRGLERLSQTMAHYADHKEHLYRPYLTVYLIMNTFMLLMIFRAFELDVSGLDRWVGLAILNVIAGLILALVAYRMLDRKKTMGVNLFVLLLLHESMGVSFISSLIGVYVIGNAAFRRAWAEALPAWYQRIAAEFDSSFGSRLNDFGRVETDAPTTEPKAPIHPS